MKREGKSTARPYRSYPSYWRPFQHVVDQSVFTPSVLRASDGHALNTYEGGAGDDTVVIANPVGIPFVLLSKLAAVLARHFRVISWEMRGSPYLENRGDLGSLSVDRHARDLAEVLGAASVERAHFVGWCGGSLTICWAITRLRVAVSVVSVSMIAPPLPGASDERTPFEMAFIPLLKEAAEAKTDRLKAIAGIFRDLNKNRVATSLAERDLNDVVDLNYRNLKSIRIYGKLIRDFHNTSDAGATHETIDGQTTTQLFSELCKRAPVLLLHCLDDALTNYKGSVAAAEKNQKSKLILYPKGVGGHCVPFLNCEMIAADIATFVSLSRGSPSVNR